MKKPALILVVFGHIICLQVCAIKEKCFNVKDMKGNLVESIDYQITGDDFVQYYFRKQKILNFVGAAHDSALSDAWKNNGVLLNKTFVSVQKSGEEEAPDMNMTLGEFKNSTLTGLVFDNDITMDNAELADSILIPLVVLSCRDLHKQFSETSISSLIGSNYVVEEYGEFADDTFFGIISGELHMKFKGAEETWTFKAGDLFYFPPGVCATFWNNGETFLGFRMMWFHKELQNVGDIKCKSRTMINSHWNVGSTRGAKDAVGSKLNTDFIIPPIGVGTACLTSNAYDIILEALNIGYRMIDTSQTYEIRNERVEEAIGKAVKDSSIKRSEIFIVTRLDPQNKDIQKSIATSLRLLQTSYIDLVLMKDPYINCKREDCDIDDKWRVWEKLVALQDKGKILTLGIWNATNQGHLKRFVKRAGKTLSVVQDWFDPLHQESQIRETCSDEGIVFMGYGTLGGGRMIKNNEVLYNYIN